MSRWSPLAMFETAARDVPKAIDSADEAMLDGLQHAAFDYFLRTTNLRNGLVADTTLAGSPSSIAAVGFALSAYPVAVSRGWIGRADAVQRSLAALRFFAHSDQSGGAAATGFRGFYYHFLDLDTGRRTWQSELSSIDTALLLAGMLTAAAFFDAGDNAETELRERADALVRRVDWHWAQRDDGAVALGWKPECGFLNYGWDGYDEAILLYVLALGSPTHALAAGSFETWSLTYQWENIYGIEVLYGGPLFVHQFSHAWIDFRGIRDAFMREKDCDYFENSRRATQVQREYAIRNPGSFTGYGPDCWGLSAGNGPSSAPQTVAGRRQAFYGYAARGVPWGPDDGTICGPSVLGSLVFAPELVLPAVRRLMAQPPGGDGTALRASGFNATARAPGCEGWVAPGEVGLDQGLIVLMIENFRSGLLWRLGRGIPCIRRGLERAGFRGGWL